MWHAPPPPFPATPESRSLITSELSTAQWLTLFALACVLIVRGLQITICNFVNSARRRVRAQPSKAQRGGFALPQSDKFNDPAEDASGSVDVAGNEHEAKGIGASALAELTEKLRLKIMASWQELLLRGRQWLDAKIHPTPHRGDAEDDTRFDDDDEQAASVDDAVLLRQLVDGGLEPGCEVMVVKLTGKGYRKYNRRVGLLHRLALESGEVFVEMDSGERLKLRAGNVLPNDVDEGSIVGSQVPCLDHTAASQTHAPKSACASSAGEPPGSFSLKVRQMYSESLAID